MSALYDGAVVHRRFAPKTHRLRYRLFQLLLDLDELPALGRSLRLFAHNRPGLFSFHARDHLDPAGGPLRGQVEAMLAKAGIDAGGPIRVLCLPRVLGYVFNPLSLFYCHRPDGALAGVVLEVTNTFGERHCYVVAAEGGAVTRSACAKTFFVSPFMGMEMSYDFRLTTPGDDVATAIQGRDADGAPLIAAVFSGHHEALSDRALASTFVRHPLITLKVIFAIHLEALKLLAKGLPLQRKPAPPTLPVTVVASDDQRPVREAPQAGIAA